MYTFVITDENFPKTTVRKRIIEGSSLVDRIRFLVFPVYLNENMNDYKVTLEYITPITKTVTKENLILLNDTYKEYLQYVLPVDTNMTSEAGKVRLKLTFENDKIDDEGVITRYIRRTDSATLNIVPQEIFSEGKIPESDLNIFKQRLNDIENDVEKLADTKADNIILTEDGVQLTSNKQIIGDTVEINNLSDAIAENNTEGLIKIIEF